MGKSDNWLTSGEFAARSGMTPAAVTRMLREGRLRGSKQSGKWLIPESEIPAACPPPTAPSAGSTPAPRADAGPPSTGRTLSVAEFSAMTYLTETGVRQWLKCGRLIGRLGEDGQWQVEATSLALPDVQRLLR
jgi:hypothetical protein